jgi:hypothetical protein
MESQICFLNVGEAFANDSVALFHPKLNATAHGAHIFDALIPQKLTR